MYVTVNAWFWDQPATGSGQYLRRLLPALARDGAGVDAHPLTPESNSRRHLSRDLYKVWFEQMVFPRVSASRGADVAHVPYFAPPLWSSTPIVVTVHDLIPIVLPAYRGSALARAYTRLVAAGVRRADAIIADSECSKQDIVTYLQIDPVKVRVVPLAAGRDFKPATREEVEGIRGRYGILDRYVLYLGGFDQRKNVATLLEAFARLRPLNTQLVIAGRLPTTDTKFQPDPKRMAGELDIMESVVFPGWIQEGHKAPLYSGAECFVFPSLYEGFGLPVLEAMACGTPVITSKASSLPEVVGDAGLTVAPRDVDGLARAMELVLSDPDRRQAMHEASLERAGCFAWDHTAEATLSVYRETLVQ